MTATPVVLIGGSLGGGKTTVVRELLRAPHGVRLALIVNEFGEVDIDGVVLRESGADVIELPNGCLCCATGGDLGGAIDRLLRGAARPDAIVVELSGVADPYPLLREVELLAPRVALQRVVAVVDLECPPTRAVTDTVVLRLLTFAGAVILNKMDRVDPERVGAWRDIVSASNPRCSIVASAFGQVSPELIVGVPDAVLPPPTIASPSGGARRISHRNHLPAAAPFTRAARDVLRRPRRADRPREGIRGACRGTVLRSGRARPRHLRASEGRARVGFGRPAGADQSQPRPGGATRRQLGIDGWPRCTSPLCTAA
jgi:G3E family GTPase